MCQAWYFAAALLCAQAPDGGVMATSAPRHRPHVHPSPQSPQAPVKVVPVARPGHCDFCRWVNGVRARVGVAPVIHDGSLDADAQRNNTYQQGRGLGHFFMGRARRQNAGMCPTLAVACQMWLVSPGHYSALVDPTVRFIGVASLGQWHTYSAR